MLRFFISVIVASVSFSAMSAIPTASWQRDTAAQAGEGRRIVTLHPSLAASRITRRAEPVYPESAKAAGVSGAVLLDVTVDEQGAVEAIQPLSGFPILLDAAAETVRDWRYLPLSQDGTPVAFKATLVVNFLLTDGDTPHLWLSEDGVIGKQGSKESLSPKDLSRLVRKAPSAIISYGRDISFQTLENTVRQLSELGLADVQISFFSVDEGRLYHVARNPGVPEGPEVKLPDNLNATVPVAGDPSLSTIFQIFVSAEGQATKVVQKTGPLRPEIEETLRALKLEKPIMWNNEAVPATFYLRAY